MMRWRIAEDYAAAMILDCCSPLSSSFLIVPIGVAVILSFDDREFIGTFPPTRLSLRWYRAFMQNPSYLDGLVVSLKLALVATMISIVAGAEQLLLSPSRNGADAMWSKRCSCHPSSFRRS
jgi:ABC-type spermidine/putrescine transport system permease subunit II